MHTSVILFMIILVMGIIGLLIWLFLQHQSDTPSSARHKEICSNYNDKLGTIINIKNDTGKTVNAYLDKYKPPCLPIDDGEKYTCNPPDGNLKCGEGSANSASYHRIKGYPNASKECTWENNDACMTIVSADGKEWMATFKKYYDKEQKIWTDQNWQTLKPNETWRIRLPLSDDGHPYYCSDTSAPDLKAGKFDSRSCSGAGGWFTPEGVYLTEPKGVHRHEWNVNALDNKDIKEPMSTRPDDLQPGQLYYNLSAVDGINSEMNISYSNIGGCHKDSKFLDPQIDKCSNVQNFSLEDCPKENQAMIWLSEPYNTKNNAIYTCLSPCGSVDVVKNSGTGKFLNDANRDALKNNLNICAAGASNDEKLEYHKQWDAVLWDDSAQAFIKNPNQADWSKNWSNYINTGIEDLNDFSGDNMKKVADDSCLTYKWSFDEEVGNSDNSVPRVPNPFKPLKVCDFKEGNTLDISVTKVLDGVTTSDADPLSKAPTSPF